MDGSMTHDDQASTRISDEEFARIFDERARAWREAAESIGLDMDLFDTHMAEARSRAMVLTAAARANFVSVGCMDMQAAPPAPDGTLLASGLDEDRRAFAEQAEAFLEWMPHLTIGLNLIAAENAAVEKSFRQQPGGGYIDPRKE
jgi:hypothetical protein